MRIGKVGADEILIFYSPKKKHQSFEWCFLFPLPKFKTLTKAFSDLTFLLPPFFNEITTSNSLRFFNLTDFFLKY